MGWQLGRMSEDLWELLWDGRKESQLGSHWVTQKGAWMVALLEKKWEPQLET